MSEYYDDGYGEFDEYPGEDRERIEVNVYELAELVKGIVEGNAVVVLKMLNDNVGLSACADATGRTLLMYAAYAGSNNIVKMFLDNELIPPGVEDLSGFTAFDWATLGGNLQGAQMIHRWIEINQPLD
tara:strand:+ start:2519 stop:2902 length:384 start_codon:yes stop_codon:yes gene_type:complete